MCVCLGGGGGRAATLRGRRRQRQPFTPSCDRSGASAFCKGPGASSSSSLCCCCCLPSATAAASRRCARARARQRPPSASSKLRQLLHALIQQAKCCLSAATARTASNERAPLLALRTARWRPRPRALPPLALPSVHQVATRRTDVDEAAVVLHALAGAARRLLLLLLRRHLGRLAAHLAGAGERAVHLT